MVVKMRRPLLRPSLIKSRLEILDAFRAEIKRPEKILDAILYPCAEVAEKMLIDLNEQQRIIMEMRVQNSGPTCYKCRICSSWCIKEDHRFCSSCGAEIMWLEAIAKKYRGM